MTELSMGIIKNRIRKNNPGLSELELNHEVFKALYLQDLGEEEVERIITHRSKYFEGRQSPLI
jgi:hypothetical protein